MRYAPRHAALTRLVDEVSETCNIGILDADSVLYLDRVESNFPLRAELHPGSKVPIHSTGLGKLFLANLPTRTRKRVMDRLNLEKFTEKTIVDIEALEADCLEIKKRGFSINNEEYHDGIISVAVPIFETPDHVIAGLALHAPAARMTLDAAIALVPTLNSYAEKIAADFSAEKA